MSNTEYILRLATEGDQKKWDEYADSHSAASPYHLFAWKKAVEESYKHKGYYLLAEKDGKVVGLLPLIHFRLPFLLNEINSLPFCDVGNILCENNTVAQLLFKESQNLCRKMHVKKMHLRGPMELSAEPDYTLYPESHDKVRMFLELPESSEVLMQSFKSKLRSQIRKAEKNGMFFSWSGEAEINDYYTVFSKNMRDLGSPVHSKKWFKCILKHFTDRVKMGIVKYEEEVVGCCILLSVGKTVAIPWASTLREYNRLAPNMLLYWNVLKYSADNGFTLFDFGRSSKGEGTYKFKKQWGATPTPLLWYNLVQSSSLPKTTENQRGKVNKAIIADIWSKMPTPLANIIGPKIRKYISL